MTEGAYFPLDAVCNVEYGTRVVQKRDGGSVYPVYGGGGATFNMDSFNREDRLVVSRFGMSEECARFVSGKFFLNDSGLTVSAKDGKLLPRFLDYQILSKSDEIFALGKGAAQKNLDVPAFRALQVFVPADIDAQHRIVAILDEAFDGIATAKTNAEKNLQNARALFQSHLQSVFTERGEGWVETTLNTCCDQIFAGGDVPKNSVSPERTTKFSVPIYSNGAKDDGLYGYTEVARVTEPSITISARGTIGFAAIRTEPFLPVVRLIVLIPDERLIKLSFLYYAVLGMDFGNTGASIPQLTVPNLRDRKLYLPSLQQQREVVAKLDGIREETRRLESICQQKLSALDRLKKSLLHQAFSGAL